jgi:hypothetical protein
MMFAGIEATRATTNYAKHNSREIARITSNTAKNLWAEHTGDGWQDARGQLREYNNRNSSNYNGEA